MHALPDDITAILAMFGPLFSQPTFEHVKLLLVGAILAPGRRTVAAVLRIMGLAQEPQFQQYHRVLNRAVWSSRRAAGILLQALVAVFGGEPLVIGLDETLERRRGAKIAAKGIYRDAVRSSHSFFVKASGLRWIAMMLLAPIPWAGRVWALPFFTVLAPSERYHAERGLPHKTLAEWAGQMLSQLRRWLPERSIVLVADSTYAVLSFLRHCAGLARPVIVVTRLRLDARLGGPPRFIGYRKDFVTCRSSRRILGAVRRWRWSRIEPAAIIIARRRSASTADSRITVGAGSCGCEAIRRCIRI